MGFASITFKYAISRLSRGHVGVVCCLLLSACFSQGLDLKPKTQQLFKESPVPVLVDVSSPQVGKQLGAGKELVLTLHFSNTVFLTLGAGGARPSAARVQLFDPTTKRVLASAIYVDGSGSSELRFRAVVSSSGEPFRSVVDAELELNGDRLTDESEKEFAFQMPVHSGALLSKQITLDNQLPELNSISTAATSSSNRVLRAGEKLTVRLAFGEGVTVRGMPVLSLEIRSPAAGAPPIPLQASFVRQLEPQALDFEATIAPGISGTEILPREFIFATGSGITDLASNSASIAISEEHQDALTFEWGTLQVDSVPPTLTSLSSPHDSSSLFGAGQSITLSATFSEPVSVTGGAPSLALSSPSGAVASYLSGSAGATLSFVYSPTAGHSTSSMTASSLNLNGARIQDAAGNEAILTTVPKIDKALVVDTSQPSVSLVAIEPESARNKSYGPGSTITISVGFNKPIQRSNLGGAPVQGGKLELTLAGTTYTITEPSEGWVLSGSKLLIPYTVQEGQSTSSGTLLNYSSTNALTGPALRDAAGNTALLALPAPTSASSLKSSQIVVDSTAPTLKPSGVTTTAGSYKAGSPISFRLEFNEAVTVSGTPQLQLSAPAGAVASFISGSGSQSATLTFSYTPSTGENTSSITTAGVNLNGGSIRDLAGNAWIAPASLSITGGDGVIVDTDPPQVMTVRTDDNAQYKIGASLDLYVETQDEEKVFVTGSPTLPILVGGNASSAIYLSGSGTSILKFRRTITEGETGPITLASSAQVQFPTGSSIADAAGNSLSGELPDSIDGEASADGEAPQLASIGSTSSSGTYNAPTRIPIVLNFNEPVAVTNPSTISLGLNSGTTASPASASLTSGSGTASLTFTYEVRPGDGGTALDVTAIIGDSTLTDLAGNPFDPATIPAPGAGGSLSSAKALEIRTTEPVILSLNTSRAAGSYKAGNVIPIEVLYSQPIQVEGSPTLRLALSSTQSAEAPCSGHNNNNKILLCSYTISAGQTAAALAASSLSVTASARVLAAAAPTVQALTSFPDLTLHSDLGKIAIDTTSPTITALTSASDRILKAGETASITLTFSEPVYIKPSTQPALALRLGTTNRSATAQPPSGSTVRFDYVVQPTDPSATVSLTATPLSVGLVDRAGNDASLSLPSGAALQNLRSDTTNPAVSAVVAECFPHLGISPPHCNGVTKLAIDQVLRISVMFTEPIQINSEKQSPVLKLKLASTDPKSVTLTNAAGSSVQFNYTITAGDSTRAAGATTFNILDYFDQSALVDTAGAITDRAGNTPSSLALPTTSTLTSSGSLGRYGFSVDGERATIASITSTATAQRFNVPDPIAIRVIFSEPVTVTGTPTLSLNSGGTASYTTGSGTSTLTFNHVVAAGQNTLPDSSLDVTQVLLGATGAIKDSFGNAAQLSVAGKWTTPQLVVDTTTPTIVRVSSTLADGTYGRNAVVAVTAAFSEPVAVTGVPSISLTSGGIARYVSGTSSSTLTFNYTVTAPQGSADLNYSATHSLFLNSGTLRDLAGNDAALALPALDSPQSLAGGKNLVIKTSQPTITAVSATNPDGFYPAGSNISITAAFSEPVTVTGTPTMSLNPVGTATASYTTGSGTSTLTFHYTVLAGQNSTDLNYASASALALSGGSINDAFGNPASLTLSTGTPPPATSLAGSKNIVIDTTSPVVDLVTSSAANGLYGIGREIPIQVVFTEPVVLVGGSDLALETGTTVAARAFYSSGSTSSTLTFNYTVSEGQRSTDLNYQSPGALGGRIFDRAGNAAIRTLPPLASTTKSLGGLKALQIDGVRPVLANFTSNACSAPSTQTCAYINAGKTVTITANWSEPVVVQKGTSTLTSSPDLSMELRLENRNASVTLSGRPSATTAMTFHYIVQPGDNARRLEVDTSDIVVLEAKNGVDVRDAAGNLANYADKTALSPLRQSYPITIDTTPPVLADINAIPTITDTNYTITGSVVSLSLTFSEPVKSYTTSAGGSMRLYLNADTSSSKTAFAPITHGTTVSETRIVTYTVAAAHQSSDLDALSAVALELKKATIIDQAGNTMVKDANSFASTPFGPSVFGSLAYHRAIQVNCTGACASASAKPSLASASTIAAGDFATRDPASSSAAGPGWTTLEHSAYLRPQWTPPASGVLAQRVLIYRDDHCEAPFQISEETGNRIKVSKTASNAGFEARPEESSVYTYQVVSLLENGSESMSICSSAARLNLLLPSDSAVTPAAIDASAGSSGKEHLFDSMVSPNRLAWMTSTEGWIEYRLAQPTIIGSYAIFPGELIEGQTTVLDAPVSWKLEGANDDVDSPNTSWVVVDGRESESSWKSLEGRTFSVAHPGSFKRYRLLLSQGQAGTETISIHEFRLFESKPSP